MTQLSEDPLGIWVGNGESWSCFGSVPWLCSLTYWRRVTRTDNLPWGSVSPLRDIKGAAAESNSSLFRTPWWCLADSRVLSNFGPSGYPIQGLGSYGGKEMKKASSMLLTLEQVNEALGDHNYLTESTCIAIRMYGNKMAWKQSSWKSSV